MNIWTILFIYSDFKWCINLRRRLFCILYIYMKSFDFIPSSVIFDLVLCPSITKTHFIFIHQYQFRSKVNLNSEYYIKKKEEIWLSPLTKAPTLTEISKWQSDNTNNATKCSITQWLRTDLGRSVGVTTVTQLVCFTGFTGPTFQLTATAV